MKKLLSLIALTLVLGSCYDNQDESEVVIIRPVPPIESDTDLTGNLNAEEGMDDAGYVIEIGDQAYEVSAEPFYIEDVRVRKEGQIIKALREDQVVGISTEYLIEFDLNKIDFVTELNHYEQVLDENDMFYESTVNLSDRAVNVQLTKEIMLDDNEVLASGFTLDSKDVASAFGVSSYAFDENGEAQLLSLIHI